MPRRLLLLLTLLWLIACGGGAHGPAAAPEPKPDLDADPLALLPAGAVVLARVDARAVFDGPALGPRVAALIDRLVPLGPDAGFDARRDVDRVLIGSYAATGVDVAAVVTGRFDEQRFAAQTTSRSGAPLVRTPYAGRTTCAAGPVVYALLSARTLVAGTSDGVRRVLDRIAGGKLGRVVTPWMVETVEAPKGFFAAAGDFTTLPLAAAALGAVRMPWLDGMREARLQASLEPPGLNLAARLTFAEAGRAAAAADGARALGGWVRVLGPLLGGASLQALDIQADGSDVRCTVAVDDQSLGRLLGLGDRFLPGAL